MTPRASGPSELEESGEPDLLMLDAVAAARKRAAVEAYAPLAEEARALLSAEPLAMLRECLLECGFGWSPGWVPAWERTARERVRDGCYETPLGYDAHVRPVALALVGCRSAPAWALRSAAYA